MEIKTLLTRIIKPSVWIKKVGYEVCTTIHNPVHRPMQQWVLASVNPSSSKWTDMQLHKPYLFILTRPQRCKYWQTKRQTNSHRPWNSNVDMFIHFRGLIPPYQCIESYCTTNICKDVSFQLSTTKRPINK